MSIILNDNIGSNAPKPIDDRYYNGLVPYTSLAEVNTLLVSTRRYRGLVVNISGAEYWYKDGIEDNGLVLKMVEGASGSTTTPIAVNYSQLYNSITTSALTSGMWYLITDFQTIYDQPDYNLNGTLKTILVTKSGTTEPLLIRATSSHSISLEVISTLYPEDVIHYDYTYNVTEIMGQPAKGRIIYRQDEQNNQTEYDHRAVVFKRYPRLIPGEYLSGGTINPSTPVTSNFIYGNNTLFLSELSANSYLFVGDLLEPVSSITSDTQLRLFSAIPAIPSLSLRKAEPIGIYDRYVDPGTSAFSGINWISIFAWNGVKLVSFCGYFLNAATGFTGGAGTISRTNDGGQNWSSIKVNTNVNNYSFISNQVGWACGYNSIIFKTVDGGLTWSTGRTTVTNYNLYDIHFLDANTGITVGAAGKIFRTVDGGSTWSTIFTGQFPNFLNVVKFYDASSGWTMGGSGMIMKTLDGGLTWTAQTKIDTMNIHDFQIIDANQLWVIKYSQTGGIMRSLDGGATWNYLLTGVGYIWRLACKNEGEAVAGTQMGDLYFTTDSGISWTKKVVGSSIRHLQYVDNQLYVIGNDGFGIYGTQPPYMELPTFGNSCYNNQLTGFVPTTVKLNNNVFYHGATNNILQGQAYNNTFGEFCVDNLFRGQVYNNNISNDCAGNQTGIGGNLFANNLITSNFTANLVGYMTNNHLVGYCGRNTFVYFTFNKADYMSYNVFTGFVNGNYWGNGQCNNNTFLADTDNNLFLTVLSENIFHDLVRNNVISGASFLINIFQAVFMNNYIGSNFIRNYCQGNFISNAIGSYFQENTLHNFDSNQVGVTYTITYANLDPGPFVVGGYISTDNIGNYYQILADDGTTLTVWLLDALLGTITPELGEYFNDGVSTATVTSFQIDTTTRANFNFNELHSFYNNYISGGTNGFRDNTITMDFHQNFIGNDFMSNSICGPFDTNIVGDTFNTNYINSIVNNNTIGNNFQRNYIYGVMSSLDFSTATLVYQPMTCEFLEREDGTLKLRHINNSDATVITNPIT